MSEQAEQTSDEIGSLGAEAAVLVSPDAHVEPAPVEAGPAVESPGLAPGLDASGEILGIDVPKADAAVPKIEAPEFEANNVESIRVDAPKFDAAKPDAPRVSGKVMVLSFGDHADGQEATGAEAESGPGDGTFPTRRLSALAAVVALAAVAGALGGALATTSFGHVAEPAVAGNSALETTVARLDADMLALKASVEHTVRTSVSQFNKTSDRLDKVEKAQLEPAARLAKLSEAVDKLHAASPAAPVPVAAAPAAKEITGSITPPATTAAVAPPKPELGRLPVVENWVLRDVGHGGALIEGRLGVFEVYPGDSIPGLGRIDAVRRQDGRWVVVTSKGLIAAR